MILDQDARAQEEDLPPARQNQILREYFRRQYSGIEFNEKWPEANDFFVERYIDRRIDVFLQQVREKLSNLKSRFAQVQEIRERTLSAPATGRDAVLNRKEWRRQLKELRDVANALRETLAFIFTDLDSKGGFKPKIEDRAVKTGFDGEMNFMEEQIKKAEQRIVDYLFVPRNTVNLQDLQDENMLIHLYRVKELADEIRDKL